MPLPSNEPCITIGIVDRRTEVSGCLEGSFMGNGFGPISGRFSARPTEGMITLFDATPQEVVRSPWIRLATGRGGTFTLSGVTIGNRFHWERMEDQTFRGDLVFLLRADGTVAAVNELPLEDYLTSVISSEMSPAAPIEFLKTHAILSRSWLLSALERRRKSKESSLDPLDPMTKGSIARETVQDGGEVARWYDREEHDLFDVCADDHCQRYQGITKITSAQAGEAIRQTRGLVITHRDEICDARYSKACGGLTEEFGTAWDNERVPYLVSVSDAAVPHPPISTEEEAARWLLSAPEAYCHTGDELLMAQILSEFDRETAGFFRWTMEYSREELEEIVREKSGFDFGTLQEIAPLTRGPSGRISRLRIVGSKRSMIVGKELEIRRWLSRSHLYSSAFIVAVNYNTDGQVETFTFHGAGWGHGVGLCQIGAAVMASQGFKAKEIIKHYFTDTEIKKLYR